MNYSSAQKSRNIPKTKKQVSSFWTGTTERCSRSSGDDIDVIRRTKFVDMIILFWLPSSSLDYVTAEEQLWSYLAEVYQTSAHWSSSWNIEKNSLSVTQKYRRNCFRVHLRLRTVGLGKTKGKLLQLLHKPNKKCLETICLPLQGSNLVYFFGKRSAKAAWNSAYFCTSCCHSFGSTVSSRFIASRVRFRPDRSKDSAS